MRNIPIGSVGILQIDDVRYGFRPLEVYSEFGQPPIMKGEFFTDVFQVSNRYQGVGVAYCKIAEPPTIKNVIFNDPATIVYWDDGTKTVVKCQTGDTYSKETGLALCIAKKYLGNKGNFNEVFKKWIPEEINPVEEYGRQSSDIRVGDKVRVINPGVHYGMYKDWVDRHVTSLHDRRKWNGDRAWGTGAIGVVKYIAPHEDSENKLIAYVEIGNQCSMIGVCGLEKVEEA